MAVDLPSRPRPTVPKWVSYTWWRLLHECPLAGAYHADTVFAPLRRPSTFGALGVVRHEIADRIGRGFADGSNLDAHQWFDREWDALVAEQAAELARAWTPARPPVPRKWPNYEYVRASVRRSFVPNIADRRSTAPARPPHPPSLVAADHPRTLRAPAAANPARPDTGPALTEEWFFDHDRGFRGQLDRVEASPDCVTVSDLKSGVGRDGSQLVERHRPQMLFYAGLVESAWGVWPQLQLVAADGAHHPIAYEPADVEEQRRQIARDVTQFRELAEGADSVGAARPSASACRYCPYQIVCKPLLDSWEAVTNGEDGAQSGPALATGRVVQTPNPGTAVIDQERDLTCAAGNITLTGLPKPLRLHIGDLLTVSRVRPISRVSARVPWNADIRIVPAEPS